MSDQPQTYSIRLRLRREIVQDAYVSVFVDEKVVTQQADGSFKIDMAKLTAEALRIGNDPRMDWQPESTRTEPHPLQAVMPEGRSVLDTSWVD